MSGVTINPETRVRAERANQHSVGKRVAGCQKGLRVLAVTSEHTHGPYFGSLPEIGGTPTGEGLGIEERAFRCG